MLTTDHEKQTYSVEELAELLGLSASNVRRILRRDGQVGDFKPIRIGARYLFGKAHVEAVLAGQAK